MSRLRTVLALRSRRVVAVGTMTRVLAPVLVVTTALGVTSAATWSSHKVASPMARPAAAVARPASDGQSPAPGWVAQLSAGAPAGALTLTAEPVMVAHPVAATPALISALAANGIPQVALNAYRVAAARIDQALPGCGIDWSLIAAIGRVESDHGQFAGATLRADGTSTPPIIGPALNGRGFAYIADTDHGLFDGDTVYDHAVGPMQFIPSTWSSYAVDGNGDGTATPMDINDAALAAAHYLCIAGGDLSSSAGQSRAVLAYNHSDAYLAEVLALAHGYATGTQIDAPLVGSTSAPVAAPTGYYQAPAAPGPAPAAYPSSGASRPGSPGRQQPATRPAQPAKPAQPGPAAPATAAPATAAPAPAGPGPGAPAGPTQPPLPAPVPTVSVPTVQLPPVPTGPGLPSVKPSPTCLLPPLCPAVP